MNEDIQNGLTAIVVGVIGLIGGSFYVMITMFGG
jgi:hypothetical protein